MIEAGIIDPTKVTRPALQACRRNVDIHFASHILSSKPSVLVEDAMYTGISIGGRVPHATPKPLMAQVCAVLLALAATQPAAPAAAMSNAYFPYLLLPAPPPHLVAVGDVNCDGRSDVVGLSDRIVVYLQNDRGQLQSRVEYPYGAPDYGALEVGDVNGDGCLDVVIGTETEIRFRLQGEGGSLGAMTAFASTSFWKLKIADINRDGRADIVGIGRTTEAVAVLYQNAAGSWGDQVTYAVPHHGSSSLALGDVNTDGLIDIIVVTRSPDLPEAAVLRQLPDGTFGGAIQYDLELDVGSRANAVAVGDVNADGRQDVVVAYGEYGPTSGVAILLQDASGNLVPQPVLATFHPVEVAVSDVDGDGRQDILVAHHGDGVLGVFVQDPGSGFLPEERFPIGGNTASLSIGDFTGDGLPDVALADERKGLVILQHRPPAAEINVSPSAIDFGKVPAGEQATQTLWIYNSGAADLLLGGLSLQGPDPLEFTLANDTCSGQTLPPYQPCSIDVRFASSSGEGKESLVAVPSNDLGVPLARVVTSGNRHPPHLFNPYDFFPLGSEPKAVAIGDGNGDGRKDVAVVTSYGFDPANEYKLFLFRQTPEGRFAPPVKYATSGTYGSPPSAVAIGDVNNDGRADVVVGISGASIEVFLQGESGELRPSTVYPTCCSTSLGIADLNHDGLLDVVGIGSRESSDVVVFHQSPGGTLGGPVTHYAPNGGFNRVATGDVTGDGLADAIVMSGQFSDLPNFSVLSQKSGGGLSWPEYYDVGRYSAGPLGVDHYRGLSSGIAAGDLEGDGADEVVLSSYLPHRICVFAPSRGSTHPVGCLDSHNSPNSVAVADIDMDGKADIITVHVGWEALGVYLQGPDGTFRPEALFPIPYSVSGGLALGDIDGDGAVDAAVACQGGLAMLHGAYAPLIGATDLHDFGTVAVGRTATATVTVWNQGGGAGLAIGKVTTVGPAAADFSIVADGCTGRTLTPAATCEVSVAFSPTDLGARSARIAIPSNDARTPTWEVRLRGKGLCNRMTLLAPQGGETLPSGGTFSVRWAAPKSAVKFALGYSLDNGRSWNSIARGLRARRYEWKTPVPLENKKKCLVRVSGYAASGALVGSATPKAPFAIEVVRVTAPNAGTEAWSAGLTYQVSWAVNATTRPVFKTLLAYTVDGGATWKSIASAGRTARTYAWTIPAVPAARTRCKVRVTLLDRYGKSVGSDTSDRFFTISP